MSTDSRSVSERIAASLVGDVDDPLAWEAIHQLRRGVPDEVFPAAAALLESSKPVERMRGVDILAQLGSPKPSPELRKRCADLLLRLCATEPDPSVLSSIGVAFGHLDDSRGAAAMLPFVNHPDPDARFGVCFALSTSDAPEHVAAQLKLTTDEDEDVRNWATFYVGSGLELDSAEIREALWNRVEDSNDEIAGEAILGLARRKDPRAATAVSAALDRPAVNVLVLEAAAELADPSFLPQLVALRAGPSDDPYVDGVLEDAIAAVTARGS